MSVYVCMLALDMINSLYSHTAPTEANGHADGEPRVAAATAVVVLASQVDGGDDREGVLAAALFKRQGYHNLRVVEGGWEAVDRENGIAKEKDPGKLN